MWSLDERGRSDLAGKLKSSPLFVSFRSQFPSIETACLVVLAGLLIWKGIFPAWRALNTDFPNYYLVARLTREGYSLNRIYDWVWLQRIKDHWGLDQDLVGFAGLTPFSALPVLPLSFYSAIVAKRLWIVANILFLSGTVESLSRVTSLGRRRIWILCLLAISPLRTSFLYGQMHLLVLLLLALAYLFHRRGRPIACGACLSIAGVLKVYPLLFGAYFLWKGRRREVLAMFCSTLLLLGIGWACMGGPVIHTYLTEVLPRSLQGEVLDPYSARAASGAAFFHRLFIFEPQLNPMPALNSPLLYAMLYPLWQIAVLLPLFSSISPGSRRPDTEQLEWAAVIFSLLVLSPVPASYHFVVMSFSVVLLVDVLARRQERGRVAIVLALYLSVSMIEFSPVAATDRFSLLTLLAFARLWIEMLLWVFFVLCLRRKYAPLRVFRSSRRAWLLGLSLALWIAGFVGYRRHFAYLEQDISRRMPLQAHTYLATGLRAQSDGYLFTAMVPGGYHVLDQRGSEVRADNQKEDRADQLSFAIGESYPFTLLELADTTGSRIVAARSTTANLENAPRSWRQLPNAESPAISPDGATVAFIREERGKGELWLAGVQTESGGASMAKPPAQIVANTYDVRDVTFASSGSIVFTAKVGGKTSIYKVTPGNQPSMFLSEDDDVASPQISSDGRLVAYRRMVHRRWQLATLDLVTNQKRYLTSGDCNAYSPTWMNRRTIGYATDCGRGLGLTALAEVEVGP
ncbi:MAG: glycosyltransferase 87 family protein [Acidobacteriaceae bacterium]